MVAKLSVLTSEQVQVCHHYTITHSSFLSEPLSIDVSVMHLIMLSSLSHTYQLFAVIRKKVAVTPEIMTQVAHGGLP